MDTSSPLPLLKAIVPKVPLIGKTALYHTLGLSDTSKQWDLWTELTVNVLRSFLEGPPRRISSTQNLSIKDPGIKGKMWVSKVTLPPPEDVDIQQALFEAIEALKWPGQAAGSYAEPELSPVQAEWTGYRADAIKSSPELDISEAEKYGQLMREATSPTTILYFHGGGFYLLDPASHRLVTSKLAKLTKGRCLSVRYRLAPQNPFPAALLDALVSYLTLLYPPDGSLHAPIDSRHIVISGDSAGGNLSMVLLQTLLEWQRQGRTIRWNGESRSIPLPAGVACNSAWMDVSHSSPSCLTNWKYDYLPLRAILPEDVAYPPCSIWPADPPRNNFYAEDAMICHPLVSPFVVKDWRGSCPLWFGIGEEMLADESKYVAMRAVQQGVVVIFEEYAAMPHCFALVLPGTAESRRYYGGWTSFINRVVENPESVTSGGVWLQAKTLKESALDLAALSTFTEEEVVTRVREKVAKVDVTRSRSLSKL